MFFKGMMIERKEPDKGMIQAEKYWKQLFFLINGWGGRTIEEGDINGFNGMVD